MKKIVSENGPGYEDNRVMREGEMNRRSSITSGGILEVTLSGGRGDEF